MPAVVELMDKAVLMVAGLDEPGESNYVRKHIVEDSQDLEKTSGLTKEEAWRNAAYRIFGDAPGTYGAGIGALLDAKNWQTIDDLAEVYVRWVGHAFGGKTKGEYMPQLFKKRLSVMDVTIKNEDNHETNMLSSDDYNAYHGGMIAAVRSIRGEAPHSYAGDTTNRAKVGTRTVQEEAKRIFLIHPIFHDFAGRIPLVTYRYHLCHIRSPFISMFHHPVDIFRVYGFRTEYAFCFFLHKPADCGMQKRRPWEN